MSGQLAADEDVCRPQNLLDTVRSGAKKALRLSPKGNRIKHWLGDRDSNPDTTVQSRMSCRWTIPQSHSKLSAVTPILSTPDGANIGIEFNLSS
jgi:hypothetical protein